VPAGSVVVAITRLPLIVNISAVEALAPEASATFAVKLNAPAAVGVPLSRPAELKVTPAGSAPALIDHVNGAVPPDRTSVCAYATPEVPVGSGDEVVMLNAALMTAV
jgi:hypothetical protein